MGKKYYYKAMRKDMKCRDSQFKVGEIYTIDSEELELCTEKVFHFCEKLEDTINYYNSSTDRHFLIETLGDIITDENKSGSNKIRIVREISRDEIEEHIQDKETSNAKEFLSLYSPNIETLEILSKDKNWWLRLLVADNLNTPAHLLEKLFKDEDWGVRRAVADNPNTQAHLLEDLSKDEHWQVRRAVAGNPNTHVHILEQLAKDEVWGVRWNVARNLNTPAHLLEDLSKDEVWAIRRVVAENSNTPVYILKELTKDENLNVVGGIIENPNTPIYLLEELTNSKKETVRKTAQARLKEITQ